MAVTYQDYYKTLGVERTASHDEIRRAYRKLARKYHPDINHEPGSEEKFKEINEAYEVLQDPETRAKYDNIGPGWQGGQEYTPPSGWENVRFYHTGEGGGDYSDFFQAIFGNLGGFRSGEMPGGGRMKWRGRDYESEIEITLEEAINGVTRTIEFETVEIDDKGQPTTGRQSYDVKIPVGVTEGSRVRLSGQGGKGAGGGESGDLYLIVRLRPDPRFRVENHDLHATVDVAPWEAALGAKVNVPTVGGSVNMTLPAGTQSGKAFRLRGKGIPKRSGPPGDLLVTARIVVPSTLSERERTLFEELAQESKFRPRGH